MVVKKLNSGVQVSIFRVLAVAGDWEEDNCFIKGVIAIASLILHEQRAFHHLYHVSSWLEADKAMHWNLLSSS